MLDPVTVTGTLLMLNATDSSPNAARLDEASLASQRTTTSDTAVLLQNIPGVSLYGAGGISSLPAIRGLADDRIRIQVDGTDLMASCPNHMNSPLSYINPTKVASITVFPGIAPVSVGGDSIGGTILVKSAPPEFVEEGERVRAKGDLGTFYRSNGQARGYNFGVSMVGSKVNLSYSESHAQADNYRAAAGFKAVAQGREGGPLLPADRVASSNYSGSRNREAGLALQHDIHLLQFSLSEQQVDFEGFPNQRMDMTENQNRLMNLRYRGEYEWGDLEARAYHQETRHEMDMGPDRYFYGTGMPMNSKGKTSGALLQGNLILFERDILRLGTELQNYTLYDWWPAVGGVMGPNDFWNVDYGQRNKIDLFVEWEATWSPAWTTQLGVRNDNLMTDAAPVQGYDNSLGGLWGEEAAAFNALERQQTDHNWDATVLTRYTPDSRQSFEAGFARKSRSPNLYQRYPWSTNAMVALMNNFVGDGNGYIGNVDLKPEVANTLSLTGSFHDPDQRQWELKATGYYTYVQDYIDARRCDFGQCSAENLTSTSGFVFLQYVNQAARLYGLDLSGQLLLGQSAYGKFTGSGLLNYVRGENRTSGDNLYNIMPLNAKFSLVHSFETWTNTAEVQLVAAKTEVSQVRNEVPTAGYGLVNLRSSYSWKRLRLDFDIENLFDRFYAMPLGGAYVGQGSSMTSNGVPWGIPVPGRGRSFNVALNLSF
jgi:iron complex outermembrane receptor protein